MIGLIHDIPTCDALVKRIEQEAHDCLQRNLTLFHGELQSKL